MKFAAIVENSYTTDGGHGYVVYSTSYKEFVPFESEAHMNQWLKDYSKHKKFQLIQYEDLEVVTTTVVKKPEPTLRKKVCNCGGNSIKVENMDRTRMYTDKQLHDLAAIEGQMRWSCPNCSDEGGMCREHAEQMRNALNDTDRIEDLKREYRPFK